MSEQSEIRIRLINQEEGESYLTFNGLFCFAKGKGEENGDEIIIKLNLNMHSFCLYFISLST